MTRVTHTIDELRSICDGFRANGHRVGLVPTMGALHPGHLSLVDAVRRTGAARVVVTIFVNPTQFGPGEDYDRYPRTLEQDLEKCRDQEVDLVYAPARDEVYPTRFQTHVEVEELTREHEGRFRSSHFRGVTTIVAKLFNAVGPCVAAFGRKDYQQWRVLERMTADLDMPVQVVGCPIVRENDGIAMSSRNRYLDAAGRERARAIIAGLRAANAAFIAGERGADRLERLARGPIESALDKIDYVVVADPVTLVRADDRCGERAVILVAAHLGTTRLIDNAVLGEDDLG
jgi:pantoate--beta-alanine ligase